MTTLKRPNFRRLTWCIWGETAEDESDYGCNVNIADYADCDQSLCVVPLLDDPLRDWGYATKEEARTAAVAALRDLADRIERGEQ